MGKRGYPPEFRRRVLDLVEAGRKVAEVADDLGISDQTIYNWRRQDRIDRGLEPGLSSAEKAELAAARKRIRELEAELAVHRRATELLKERGRPKRRFAAIEVMVAEGLPAQLACRVLDVSESGFYAWRSPAAVGAGDPPRLAHRPDPPDPRRLPRRVRLTGACTPSSPSATAWRSARRPCGC